MTLVGWRGVLLYICWNFYEFFVWALYMEPSPVFKVYMFTWIGGRIIIQQSHVCFDLRNVFADCWWLHVSAVLMQQTFLLLHIREVGECWPWQVKLLIDDNRGNLHHLNVFIDWSLIVWLWTTRLITRIT